MDSGALDSALDSASEDGPDILRTRFAKKVKAPEKGTWTTTIIFFLIALFVGVYWIVWDVWLYRKLFDHLQATNCDKFCTPTTHEPKWRRDNWESNSNTSWWGQNTLSIQVHNLTNAAEVLQGAAPNYDILGDYVFDVKWKNYNVTYSTHKDLSSIIFQNGQSYHYNAEKSTRKLDDVVTNFDPTVIGLVNTAYSRGYTNKLKPLTAACGTGSVLNNAKCIFTTSTVQELLFGNKSLALVKANELMWGSAEVGESGRNKRGSKFADFGFRTEFALLNNCSTAACIADRTTFFGLGGSCENDSRFKWGKICKAAARNTLKTTEYTGHGDLTKVSEVIRSFGNETMSMWPNPTNKSLPSVVGGRTHQQFGFDLQEEHEEDVWSNLLFKEITVVNVEVTKLHHVESYRFHEEDGLFGVEQGRLNTTEVQGVLHGIAYPIYLSLPGTTTSTAWDAQPVIKPQSPRGWFEFAEGMFGSSLEIGDDDDDSTRNKHVEYIVEPWTGKVLRSKYRTQINIRVGEAKIYGTSRSLGWNKIPDTLAPLAFLTETQEMGPDVHDEVRDRANALRSFTVGRIFSQYAAPSLALIFLLLTGNSWRLKKKQDKAAVDFRRNPLLGDSMQSAEAMRGIYSNVSTTGEDARREVGKKSRNRAFLTVYFAVFVDTLGYGLIVPGLPALVERFGGGAFQIGIITASFSAAQIFGSIIAGRLSDKIGRRPVLTFCLLGSGLTLAALGVVSSLNALIIVRALDGALSGTIGTAQAYVSDLTTPAERTKYIGLVSASTGLGIVMGPAIGGLIPSFSVTCFVGAGISLLNFILAMIFLKESKKKNDSKNQDEDKGKLLVLINKNKQILWVYASNFFAQVAYAAFASFLVYWQGVRWKMLPQGSGFVLTGIGISMVITQILFGGLTKKFGDKRIVIGGCTLRGIALVLMVVTQKQAIMITFCVFVGVSGALIQPCMSSLVSQFGTREDFGTLQGLNQAAGALARSITPLIGGVLADINYNYPFTYIGAVTMGMSTLLMIPLVVPTALTSAIASNSVNAEPIGNDLGYETYPEDE